MSEIVVKLRKRHENQEHIIQTAKRFNVLKCGRRFGKTSLAEELIIDPALDGFPVAYYCPTYKDLNDFWLNIINIVKDVIQSKNEQLKQIRLITGGVIDMWSLEEPDSGRGRKYKRVVIDECEKAKKLAIAYKGTIRATLTDYKGDCWFLSTPKFGDTYFKELYNSAKDTAEWNAWTFTTYDNPFMDKAEIDSAKATLDDVYFRCEYLAQDVDLKGLRWAFAYDKAKHIGKPELNKAQVVYLSFDFNKNPICCSVIQQYDNCIKVIETIKLENSDIYALCDYINVYYAGCLLMVTGDATGQGTTALVQDNLNYYRVIKSKLNLGINQIKVPTVNPRIEENQVLVNSLLANYKVEIHETKASALHFDLANVSISADNKIEKSQRSDVKQQADALDTFRYFCNTFMAWFLKVK